MSNDTSGPAFPIPGDLHPQTNGMTRRDYFAAAALTGLLADHTNMSNAETNAACAVAAADALLVELNK